MHRLKRRFCAFAAAVFVLLLPAAGADGFQTGPEVMENAAASVLALKAFDGGGAQTYMGTGFVAFDSGVLVTTCRMIRGAERIEAASEGGGRYTAGRVLAVDAQRDIAILAFDSPTDLTPLPLKQGGGPKRAEPVVYIGSPRNETNTVSPGSVIALYEEGGDSFIQFAAPVPPGPDGGALLNSRGEVVGIAGAISGEGLAIHTALDIQSAARLYAMSKGEKGVELAAYHAKEQAKQGAGPAHIALDTRVYQGAEPAGSYSRPVPVAMCTDGHYAAWEDAVLAFRGGPLRKNAACGTVLVRENKLEAAWSYPIIAAGPLDAGYSCQPAIVKWVKEIREMMNITEDKKATVALKEVILAAADGMIYFLDLYDGHPTRLPIDIGLPLAGAVSIDPRGMPMLSVKSGAQDAGFYLFDITTQKLLTFYAGGCGKAQYVSGVFSGSPLMDLNSDTIIAAVENGMLHTVWLGTQFDVEAGRLRIEPQTVSYETNLEPQSHAAGAGGNLAMFGSHAYMAGGPGVLQCVDVNTMSPVWAVDVGFETLASIALDVEADGTLALYTGNAVRGEEGGMCTIRRLNALTGEQDWSHTVDILCGPGTVGGLLASPLIGEGEIGGLAVFTLAHTREGGQMIALDKKTGAIVWQQPMDRYSTSSPVAVYGENGGAHIIQGDSAGRLQLRDGLSGVVLDGLQLNGAVIGSPAVYRDIAVVVTQRGNTGMIHGIRIR